MRIGVVGSGRIGATLARLLLGAGHDVAIANSRGPDTLSELTAELGDRAYASSADDAAAFGELVAVAIPLHAVGSLHAGPFEGKVVVDANNYFPGRDGSIPQLDEGLVGSSELLALHLPGARIVKAFNTMHASSLAGDGLPGAPPEERLAVPIAGDDAEAKRLVAAVIGQIGFAVLDTGTLAEGGRLQEPGAPFFNRPLRLPEAERALASLRA